MELHDRIMVGVRTERLELDEAWSFVGKKQKNVLRHEINAKGDQYIFIGMAGKAIISWGVGKRTNLFEQLASRIPHRGRRLQFLQIGFEIVVGDDQRLDRLAGITAAGRDRLIRRRL
jgi:hypothetical protein